MAERAEPQPDATHVRLDCADGYWEIVSIEELADPRMIFVLRMNDALLPDEYGDIGERGKLAHTNNQSKRSEDD